MLKSVLNSTKCGTLGGYLLDCSCDSLNSRISIRGICSIYLQSVYTNALALIDSKDTSILFSAVVSAPTWKLKIKAFSEELNAVLPDAPIASFTLTSASASRSLRFPVYVPEIAASVVSTFNCLLMVAEPVALFLTSIPYEFPISAIVFVTSVPSFSVTVAFVPSEVILTTF